MAMRKDGAKQNLRLQPLNLAQKLTMCSQVALGMEHLFNSHLVHQDLAARNVLLSSTLDLKIASLSLCRDVYATEYFVLRQRPVPLRWMAPEAVLEDDYSVKSDVWSFGVFAWEVFTCADLPLRRWTDDEIVKELNLSLAATRCCLECPPACPPEMWTSIEKCTADTPRDRPTFDEIAMTIGDMTADSDDL